MPGIAGIFNRNHPIDRTAAINDMVKSMVHEDTYTSGVVFDENAGLWTGWVSHRGSFSDDMPVWNDKRDICMVFSGEHFGDDLSAQVCVAGKQCSRENASHLMHLYEKEGDRFFTKLNGFFSGVILNLRERKTIVFNDRFGMGRLYVHETPEAFYFASEAKAILKVLPSLRQLDPKGLGEFFAAGYPLQNRTIFSGISLLPPASLVTLSHGAAARRERYFDKSEWENQPSLSSEQYYSELKTTLVRVLPRYFRKNERIAISLTGGLDSRIIMAWLRCAPGTLPCYTHRGIFNENADARVARQVAKTCQQPHRLIKVDEQFLRQFVDLAKRTVYLTDGAMEVSGAAGLYANRVASREISTIRMTGNYGGEILRGLLGLSPNKVRNPFFDRDFAPFVDEGIATLAAERQGSASSLIAFKQMPWEHYPRFALESSQLTVRSPYTDNELVALSYRRPAGHAVNLRLAARLIIEGNPALAAFPTDRGPLGRTGWIGRIRQNAQEFTFKADYAYDYGMPHWLVKADRVLSPLHLERLFLGRHKYYHFRYFYRNPLAASVKEILLDARSLARPYLERGSVERMVQAHIEGRGNYTTEIHQLLTMELTQRQLIEG